MSAQRHDWISDGAVLGAIGSRGAARRGAVAVGRPGRGAVRLRLAARRPLRSCSACSFACPAASPIRPRAWPPAVRAGCRAQAASTPRSRPGRRRRDDRRWSARPVARGARSQPGRERARAGRGPASFARCAAPRPRRSGRLVLGRRGGRLLYAEHRHALVAFGPPQSGKSAGIAIPALLEWDGPAVACSIKTDLLAATLTRRQALGEVLVFDPFGLVRRRAHMVAAPAAHTWDGALEVAWRLASAAEVDRRSMEGGDFWAVAAEQRLAPLLYTAAATGAGMDSVIRWVHGQGGESWMRPLMRISGEAGDEARAADAYAAYDAVRAFEAQADRTRTSIEATAQTLLRAYRFQRVLRSAATSEITPIACSTARPRCT